MSRTDKWGSEGRAFDDYVTGVRIHQLTDALAHSWHLYFHNPGWWDQGRQLLFRSHRDGRIGTWTVDLAGGDIRHVAAVDVDVVNPKRDEGYAKHGREILAVDLRSGETRPVYRIADGFISSGHGINADGRYVFLGEMQDLDLGVVDILSDYTGFRERHDAKPLSRIVRIPVDGGEPEVVFEERYWIGHVQPSLTRPELVSYCHEGPWALVDQRMWMLDHETGETWAVRPEQPGEAVGHEYWLADGETLGYHGRIPDGDGKRSVFGFVRYDNAERIEPPFHGDSNHYHSNTRDLIVGDGLGMATPYVMLWRFDGQGFDGPRVLAKHRSSRHVQICHVHPRLTPDGSQVVYTTDATGYANVYLADLPAYESLPTLEQVQAGERR